MLKKSSGDIENIKKNTKKKKNKPAQPFRDETITPYMKNILDGINGRLHIVEEKQ